MKKLHTNLGAIVVLIALSLSLNSYAANPLKTDELRITILGSGTPVPSATQYGPAILVQAGVHSYVFDCGRGCTSRLAQVDTRLLKTVERLFITHLHSDHLMGIPDLWLNGWVQQRQQPLSIWGPKGTFDMMSHLRKAFSVDIALRQADNVPKKGPGLDDDIIELSEKGGVILEEYGVKITAFAVDHSHVKPAYGYKVEYKGRSVLISGDTTTTPSLYQHSKNVDVVMLEVMSPALINFLTSHFSKEQVNRIRSYHLTAEQAGNIFAKSQPRLGLYYHTNNDKKWIESLIKETKKEYSGPLRIGHDLMQVSIGEEIEVTSLIK